MMAAAARVMGQPCLPGQFRPFTTSPLESHNHSVSMIITIIPIPDGEVETWEAEVAGQWGSLNPKSGSLASDPLTLPLLLSSVTKICAQCEMEHSADGLMEQMCSSDFGECRAHVATALSPEKHTFFLFGIRDFRSPPGPWSIPGQGSCSLSLTLPTEGPPGLDSLCGRQAWSRDGWGQQRGQMGSRTEAQPPGPRAPLPGT